MAKVPYKGTLSVAPSDTPLPPQNASGATAQNFGGMIGQAVAGLGKSIENAGDVFTKHALIDQGLQNEAASKEIFLWGDMEMGKATVEYESLEGKQKLDAYPGYVKKLEGIRDEGLKRAGNNQMVRRSFDNQFAPRMATTIVGGARTAATAKKNYETEVSGAKVANAIDDTLTNYQDEPRFLQNVETVRKEVQYQGAVKGWSPEKLQEVEREQTSKVFDARIRGIGRTDPFAARQFYEKNRGSISGADQIKIDEYLMKQETETGTRMDSDSIQRGDREPANLGPTLGTPGKRTEFKSPMQIASSFIGAHERKDQKVLASFISKAVGYRVDPSQTPWCAGWVNGVLDAGGIKGTGSLAARSFLNYGRPTTAPTEGDIAVFARAGDPSKGHVGFFAGFTENGDIKVLGGNQGDKVSVAVMKKESLLGFRTPPSPGGGGKSDFNIADVSQQLAGGWRDASAAQNSFTGFTVKPSADLFKTNDWEGVASFIGTQIKNKAPGEIFQVETPQGNATYEVLEPNEDGESNWRAISPEQQEAAAKRTQTAQLVPNTMDDGTEQKLGETGQTTKEAVSDDDPGPLTPESGPEWLEKALEKGRRWARARAPNNPKYEDTLLARIESDYNRVKRVRTQQERGLYQGIMQAVMGDYNETMIRSLDQITANPTLAQAFERLSPTMQKTVEAQIKRNSKADVVETPERFNKFQELMGVSVTDPQKFMSMSAEDYGNLPRVRQGAILAKQRSMAQKLQDTSKLNGYLRTVSGMLGEAEINPIRSDPERMATYNQFVGASQQKLQEFEQQHKRFPNETEQQQIAAGLLRERRETFWQKMGITSAPRDFEVPGEWKNPNTGASRTKEQWIEDFRKEVKREPTPQDLYKLYQLSITHGR